MPYKTMTFFQLCALPPTHTYRFVWAHEQIFVISSEYSQTQWSAKKSTKQWLCEPGAYKACMSVNKMKVWEHYAWLIKIAWFLHRSDCSPMFEGNKISICTSLSNNYWNKKWPHIICFKYFKNKEFYKNN